MKVTVFRAGIVTLLVVACAGCAHTPPYEPADPLEPINRKVYAFNRTADRYVLRPVARGYQNVTPAPVRRGVGNFLSNLRYPVTIINATLQGKFKQAGRDTGRFVVNSTAGLLGFIDVATPVGLEENNEDFGQTLGSYGIGPGWYLMLPFLGPSTNRDIIGAGVDGFSTPERLLTGQAQGGITVVDVVHTRGGLLGGDRFLEQQVDEYVALRTIYLERRLNLVYDGNPPLDYGEDEDWDDDWDDDDWNDDW